MKRRGTIALAGAAATVAAGIVAERMAVRRRRHDDVEREEPLGQETGLRAATFTTSDGAGIRYYEKGPNVPSGAVFLHGSALRADLWHYQMTGIEAHRLAFVDLRGHGLSQPKGHADYTVRTLADDLKAVLDDCKLKEVVLVGHSIGGMVALQLCRQRPDLLGDVIKGLILVNTTYRPPIETITGGAAVARFERIMRRPLDVMGAQHARVDQLRKLIKPSDAMFWTISFAAFGPGASAKHIDFTYDMLSETPSDVIFDLFRAYRDFDVTDHLAEVTVPALVIAGTEDRITIPDASDYLAQHLPKAELEVFDGAGHMTMLERHDEFNRVVQRFLDDTLETSTKRRT